MNIKNTLIPLGIIFIIILTFLIINKSTNENKNIEKKETETSKEEKNNYKEIDDEKYFMEVNGKKYTVGYFKKLENESYDKNSLNEIILREMLKELSTDKEKEEVKTSSLIYQNNEKRSKEEIKDLEENTLINLAVQRYYKKYLNITKEEYKKETERPMTVNSNFQIVINPNLDEENREKVKKELRKELDKINTLEKANHFYDIYGHKHSEDESEAEKEEHTKDINKYLDGNILVDYVEINYYTKELFENAYNLKEFSYVKIGEQNYTGFMFLYEKKKMTKEEIKKAYYEYRLLQSEYINTKEMIQKLNKEEKNVKISKQGIENIKADWNNY